MSVASAARNLVRRFSFVGTAGALTAAFGLIGLTRWVGGYALGPVLLPGIELMGANTALCLLLAGVALIVTEIPGLPVKTIHHGLGGLIATIAAVVLAQFLLDLPAPWPMLQIVVNSQLEVLSRPEREPFMAASSAAAFLLTGTALVLYHRARSTASMVLTTLLAASVFFVALLDGVVYVLDLDLDRGVLPYAGMSPFTAVGLTLLSLGLVSLHYRRNLRERRDLTQDRKLVLVSGMLFAFTTLFAVLLTASVARHQVEEEVTAGLTRSLAERVEALDDAVRKAATMVDVIANSRPLLRERVAAISAGRGGMAELRDVERVAANVVANADVVAIRIDDVRGRPLGAAGEFSGASTVPLPQPLGFHTMFLWDRGFRVRATVPIWERDREVGQVTAEMPVPLFGSLAGNHAAIGASGEMLICTGIEVGGLRCFPSRFWPEGNEFMRGAESADIGVLLGRAMNGERGLARVRDHRGETVLAAYSPLGSLGLGVMLKMDVAEVFAPYNRNLLRLLPFALVVMVVGAAVTQWWVRPLARGLRETRDRMQAVLGSMAEAVFVCTPAGVIESANPAAGTMFGCESTEFTGGYLHALFPDACRQRCAGSGTACSLLAEHVSTPGKTRELVLRRRNGENFAVEMTATVAARDATESHVVVLRDISERRRAEVALRESEEKFRRLVESMSDWIWELDERGVYTYASPRVRQMLGYSPQDVIGKTPFDLMPPEEAERVRAVFARLAGKRLPIVMLDNVALHRDGRRVMLESSATPVFGPDGTWRGYRGMGRDVTERWQMEERLRESETRLRSLAANVPGMVFQFVRRPDGALTLPYVSQGSLAVWGFEARRLQAEPGLLLMHIEPKDRKELEQRIRVSARNLSPLNWEGRLVFGLAEVKWINLRATPRSSGDGGVLWDAMAFNITATKNAEQELLESREQLERLAAHTESVREQERTRIAREIHDELGQWVTALMMDVGWLRQRAVAHSPGVDAKLGEMAQHVDTALEVVRRIAADLRPAVLDLGLPAALEWLTQDFSRRSAIACDFDWDGEEPLLAEAATAALYRIAQESLTNVLRHAQASRVTVGLHQMEGTLELGIRDNGRGLDPGTLAVTDRFGLLGMRKRAYAIGATIEILGETGQGTVVTVRLPTESARGAA